MNRADLPGGPDGTRSAAAVADPAAGAAPSWGAAGAAPLAPLAPSRVAVLGAGGYTGQEFARLARSHPGLEIVALCSREHAGRPASGLLPGLDPAIAAPPVLSPADLESWLEADAFDTLVACLPHGAWAALAAERPGLAAGVRRILDLSSDHRDATAGYVYGLPEGFRAEIAGATRVANPGCYATAATLALLPPAEAGWLASPVSVSALSGVSGAGRAPALKTSFVELQGGAWAYRAGTEHPHVGEVARTLKRRAGASPPIGFVPQVVPMARGILLTAFAPLASPVDPAEALERYAARYSGEPFVRMLPPGAWPETRAVRHSNRCDLAVTTLHEGRTLLVCAALDNLVKGAAGQAIQNLNLMNAWPETLGLTADGSPW